MMMINMTIASYACYLQSSYITITYLSSHICQEYVNYESLIIKYLTFISLCGNVSIRLYIIDTV